MKIANINKHYLIVGLKNIFHNRRKRYNCILYKMETDDEFRETIINEIENFCRWNNITETSQLTIEIIDEYLKFYFSVKDSKSPTNQESKMYIDFGCACAIYCNRRIHNFSQDIFEAWFQNEVASENFVVPSLQLLKCKIDELIKIHKMNIRNYYIISPLLFASCDKSIILNHDCAIVYPGNYITIELKRKSNIKDICKRLCSCFNINDSSFYDSLIEIFNIYKKVHREHFYCHPLLVIRVQDTFDNAIKWSELFSFYVRRCLVLSLIESGENIQTKQLICENTRTIQRYFIMGFGVHPFTVIEKHPQSEFKYNLSPLSLKQNRRRFNKLWNIIFDDNSLMNLYRKTLRIFFWDCDDNAKTLEHKDIATLMKIIAMETFLLSSSSGAKKDPLCTILSKLYKGDDIDNEDIKESLKNVYDSRSDFVHSGISIPDVFFEKINTYFSISTSKKDMDIVIRCFVNVLCNFPIWYNKQRSKNKAYNNWIEYCKSLLDESKLK